MSDKPAQPPAPPEPAEKPAAAAPVTPGGNPFLPGAAPVQLDYLIKSFGPLKYSRLPTAGSK
ncbi:hypothetical protein [Falsiroseomonas tokyonensis]|uniref:Uncharacterized protein n=1 Tax=Falsiroseomonas tokyonensis TaxID=430521 RepID=A0ABV7BS77_9PROT|nr:hypothetical protein [Falsiroseomonas tokyonensis]MBU8537688.1 hypothetical protein [Falsiroseomonas tokyonensis]